MAIYLDYKRATPDEICAHFATISRQRVQQLLVKFASQEDHEVITKIIEARAMLKALRYQAKRGCTPEEAAKAGRIWRGIVLRAGKAASYEDCTIAWTGEPAFRSWAVKQIGFMEEGFELDKDVLCKGNRTYGPDVCAFIPQEINTLLSGCYMSSRRGPYPIGVCFNKGSGSFIAQMSDRQSLGLDKYLGSFKTVEEAFACYKEAKEEKIKRLAEKWRDRVEPRVYEALLARTVEWDD